MGIRKVIIGGRSSKLSMVQIDIFKNLLLDCGKVNLDDIAVSGIVTSGDKIQDRPLYEFGGKDLFAKEIDSALLSGKIDIAVHSAKDVSSVLVDGICTPCILERGDVRDAFISTNYSSFLQLPFGATVGTCAPRRKAQLRRYRKDLNVVDLRGNIPTRLERLHTGYKDMDAIILSVAGLERLNMDYVIKTKIDTDVMLPAAGQGALMVQCRSDDREMIGLLSGLSHMHSYICVSVEREILRSIEANCNSPVAVYATMKDMNTISVQVLFSSGDGSEVYEGVHDVPVDKYTDHAKRLGSDLRVHKHIWG